MNQQHNDSFEHELRDTLRQSEQQLDTRTRARLATARRDAVEQEAAGSRLNLGLPVWGSLAAAAVVATVLIRVSGPVTEQPADVMDSRKSATDVLTAEQQLELYEHLEMLEFFDEFADGLDDEPAEERAS